MLPDLINHDSETTEFERTTYDLRNVQLSFSVYYQWGANSLDLEVKPNLACISLNISPKQSEVKYPYIS
uniref:Neur_chan_LBD domain-containing protein n=1 Tax=Panagrellus redivivus TaxID=6233 RepID=A0A7E4VJB3_PANRE